MRERVAAGDDASGMQQDFLAPERRAQLVQVLTDVFGGLDASALADVESKLEWTSLPGGATLFRQGDRGDDVYVIVNGRLRAVVDDPEGGVRVLEEVGRGSAVGELALLTGEARAATVVAVRDSDLVRLPKAAFDTLLDRHPRAMMQIARAAAVRLRRSSQQPSRAGAAPVTLALIPAGPGVPLRAFADRLTAALRRGGDVLRVGSADVDRHMARPGIAQSADGDDAHGSIVAWLSAQEREHRHVVLEADAEWTAWTRRCLRQADRVLVVGRAGDDPAPGRVESEAAAGFAPRRELVLLQSDDCRLPAGTARWLAPRDVAAHHHVRLGNDGDVERLARRVSARAVGVVLGGGGARGFAHIGMLRALAEAGIEVDVVGGTSIGALIAGAHARGLAVDEMIEVARSFASPSKLLDRTLPLASLMAARKVTALYRHLFGDVRVEDLWMPLFAVSSSLSRARAVIHRSGPLWHSVRASTAIPAIFPPLLSDDGDVLVDGSVMNNMPLDVMREWCEGGTVIALNPMPTDDKLKRYSFGPSLSGWEALKGRFRWFGSTIRAPSILGSVMRATEINSANRMRLPSFRALADLLVEPKLGGYPILAFDQYEQIIEIGYASTRDALAAWRPAAATS
ncbi:putative NTE family protein [Burkholderiales bacterium]|nr:putative NTE family protein [Burkholderiales bacterium]